jgi:uncharacterized damage-inducible protein DinB
MIMTSSSRCSQRKRETGTVSEPVWNRRARGSSVVKLHVCLHGTYHRGNAGAVLQLKGLTPSRDSITDFLEGATSAGGHS